MTDIAPQPLRDHRSRRTRLITAAALTLACLTLTGFVQSLRDAAVNRLPTASATAGARGVGAALRPQAPTRSHQSRWLTFFGISSSLVVIGLVFSYVTTDPLPGRARAARLIADSARQRRDAVRREGVASATAVRSLEAQIALNVVNATRDMWVAEGWGEVDVLERMRANPAITGTWIDRRAPERPAPPAVGESLGVQPVAVAPERTGDPDVTRVDTAEIEALVRDAGEAPAPHVANVNGHGTGS